MSLPTALNRQELLAALKPAITLDFDGIVSLSADAQDFPRVTLLASTDIGGFNEMVSRFIGADARAVKFDYAGATVVTADGDEVRIPFTDAQEEAHG